MGGWISIPSSQATCAASGHPISCDFGLYFNATDLSDNQKLAPNNEITGHKIVYAFMASACLSLVLSFFLMLDWGRCYWNGTGPRSYKDKERYLRAIHIVESMLHAVSDQQLLSGISLLFAANLLACTISAYHYNLICTMLLLSLVTHLNALVSIPDFFHKNRVMAAFRLVGFVVQIALSNIFLSARNSTQFPYTASSLAILPAACFENMDAIHDLGAGDFLDFAQNITTGSAEGKAANGTQIWDNVVAETSKKSGLGEYVTVMIFLCVTIIVLIVDGLDGIAAHDTKVSKWKFWFITVSAGISILATCITMIISFVRYTGLRNGMEIDAWYLIGMDREWSYAQILQVMLVGSTSIIFFKALFASFPSIHDARHALPKVARAASHQLDDMSRDDKYSSRSELAYQYAAV